MIQTLLEDRALAWHSLTQEEKKALAHEAALRYQSWAFAFKGMQIFMATGDKRGQQYSDEIDEEKYERTANLLPEVCQESDRFMEAFYSDQNNRSEVTMIFAPGSQIRRVFDVVAAFEPISASGVQDNLPDLSKKQIRATLGNIVKHGWIKPRDRDEFPFHYILDL